jgi:hypothetical protein
MIFTSLIASMALTPAWAVGNAMQLTWDEKDYVPIGLQCQANTTEIEQAKAAGINDFNVEMPANGSWKEIADKLEGRRFFLTMTSVMPLTKGVTVQPQYYRIGSVRNPGRLRLNLPGADKAFVLVVQAESGDLFWQKMMPVKNGVLDAEFTAAREANQTILVYPIGESLEMEDLWERLDERRDQVLRQIRTLKDSTGFRGLINPLGTTPYLSSMDYGFVPTSPIFRKEFADFIEQKYRTPAEVMKAWGLRGTSRSSFADIARLVPLWNAGRGIPYFLDPDLGQAEIGTKTSPTFWNDLAEAISLTRSRRVARITRSLRQASGVPIFQDWTGWSWFFENPDNELTGLTVRLNKFTPSGLLAGTANALSSNLRSRKPGPILAVDVPLTADLTDQSVLNEMTDYGVRGLFLRAKGPEELTKISRLTFTGNLVPMTGFFYPQNASNPAQAQKIAGNLWWLPSPSDGNRLDLGPELNGYEIAVGTSSSYVIWNNGPRKVFDLRLNNPGSVSFRSLSGLALDATTTKTGVRISLDPSPVMISGASHCPVSEAELLRLEREVANMISLAQERKRDISGEAYPFRTFRDLITSNPQKALEVAQDTHRKLGSVLAGAVWLEYERQSKNTFSAVVKDAGCSAGGALHLRTPLAESTGVVHATVNVPQRTTGALDVWIGARIPSPMDRERLRFKIGGQTMQIRGEPLSLYGSGYGWYKLGVTRLSSISNEFRAEIIGTTSTDLSLDCVLFTPLPFQPQNVKQPEFSFPEAKPPKN